MGGWGSGSGVIETITTAVTELIGSLSKRKQMMHVGILQAVGLMDPGRPGSTQEDG